MSMLDAAVVYEELGRALAPTPHFVSSVLGAGVLVAAAGGDSASSFRGIAAGPDRHRAWLEPDRGYGPQGVTLAAPRGRRRRRLSGTKRHVVYAGAAQRSST